MKNIFLAILMAVFTFHGSNGFAQTDPAQFISAANKGDTAAVKSAIASGIDVNAMDIAGLTALMAAASSGKLNVAKILLKAKADVNARSPTGQTALMFSVLSGNPAMVKLLLDKGANASIATPQGMTALDMARRIGNGPMITLLAKATAPKPAASHAKTNPADINKDISAKSAQAVQAFKAGDFARAAGYFQQMVALNPQDPFVWHFLGQSLEKTGDLDGALQAYQKSLDIAPSGDLALRNRAFLDKLQHQGKVFADCPDCPKMVIIPAGSFDMGTKSGVGYDDELPVHRVTFGKPFAMGMTEVTQGLWKSIMGNNPSANSKCGDNCPVEEVSWNDVQDFIQKLNKKTGKQYRLPSEAEWEYACRAGEQQTFCGSNDWNSVAWFEENSSHPVAEKLANAWGLYDMSGNVWEWIADPYHDSYNGAPADGSMWNGDASIHVIRGGSWYSAARYGRAAIRGRHAPDERYNDGGFRLVRPLS